MMAKFSDLPGYFRYAKNATGESNHRCSVGAAILYRGKPIAIGKNDGEKTHPTLHRISPMKRTHAESTAIFKVKFLPILTRCVMVVYRATKNGDLANSRPCPMCMTLIKRYKIPKIRYTTIDGWAEERVLA